MERIDLATFQSRCKAQGQSREDTAFICPGCNTVQSIRSLIAAGAQPHQAEKLIGFSCEGRLTGAGAWPRNPSPARRKIRGCDWSLGGLFKLHGLEVISDDGMIHPFFAIATAEQAVLLRSLRVPA